MRRQIDRDDIQHQLRRARDRSGSPSRQVGERRAGVDALVPSRQRIGQRALDHRRPHHRRRRASRAPPAPTARPGSWCSCRYWAIPSSARAAADLSLSCSSTHCLRRIRSTRRDSRRRRRRPRRRPRNSACRAWSRESASIRSIAARASRISRCRLKGSGARWGTNRSGCRLRSDGRRRCPPHSRSRRGSAWRRLAAEFDHVGDADGVDHKRLFQRGLEVDQPRAMHHRVETARLDRLRFFASSPGSVMSPGTTTIRSSR